jgi:hypothetical protein
MENIVSFLLLRVLKRGAAAKTKGAQDTTNAHMRTLHWAETLPVEKQGGERAEGSSRQRSLHFTRPTTHHSGVH